MTIISTSRKPLPEVRSLARDLAFSLGCRYVVRGKSGMADMLALHTVSLKRCSNTSPQGGVLHSTVLIVARHHHHYSLQVYHDAAPVADYRFSRFRVGRREGSMVKGLQISNQSVYDDLKRYIDAVPSRDEGDTLVFDGTQRKRYFLGPDL